METENKSEWPDCFLDQNLEIWYFTTLMVFVFLITLFSKFGVFGSFLFKSGVFVCFYAKKWDENEKEMSFSKMQNLTTGFVGSEKMWPPWNGYKVTHDTTAEPHTCQCACPRPLGIVGGAGARQGLPGPCTFAAAVGDISADIQLVLKLCYI